MYESIDDYLETLSTTQRAGLQELREVIAACDDSLEECITYNIPAFRKGKAVVAFGAAKKHLSLYPMSPAVFEEFTEELSEFSATKGTIKFTPDKPIPSGLVAKIVAFRILENQRNAK